jgi:hypothetical protein
MQFYNIAAQVLPVLFVASVFEGKYWEQRRTAPRLLLAFDIVGTASFAVGEAVALVVIGRQEPFVWSGPIVVTALVFQGLAVVGPAIFERVEVFRAKTSSREAAVFGAGAKNPCSEHLVRIPLGA